MGISIYMLIYFIALVIHFAGSDMTGTILYYAMLVPIIDTIILLFHYTRNKKLSTRNLIFTILSLILRGISFATVAIMNYYAFSYQECTYSNTLIIIFIVSFLIFLIFTFLYNNFREYVIRLSIYLVLIGFSAFNVSMTNTERLYFYTLGDPFYSTEINVERLYDFAYLYYQNGDQDRTYYLLNKSSQQLSNKLNDNKLSEAQKEAIRTQLKIIQKSITLVMQNKWNHKDNL